MSIKDLDNDQQQTAQAICDLLENFELKAGAGILVSAVVGLIVAHSADGHDADEWADAIGSAIPRTVKAYHRGEIELVGERRLS